MKKRVSVSLIAVFSLTGCCLISSNLPPEAVDLSKGASFLSTPSQVDTTSLIKDVAWKLNKNLQIEEIHKIKKILSWLRKNISYFKHIPPYTFLDTEKERELRQYGFLCARTAHEVISSKYSTGCGDMAVAFLAIANALDIKAQLLITVAKDFSSRNDKGHAYCKVYLEDREILVDPTSGKLYLDYNNEMFFITTYPQIVIAEGRDYWDIGIFSYYDLKEARRKTHKKFAKKKKFEVLKAEGYYFAITEREVYKLLLTRKIPLLRGCFGKKSVYKNSEFIKKYPLIIAMTKEDLNWIEKMQDILFIPLPEEFGTKVYSDTRGKNIVFFAKNKEGLYKLIKDFKDF